MKTFRELKLINTILPLIFMIFIFSGCSSVLGLPDYKLKETYTEKQVLVYDKTISVPTNSYVSNMQFSPVNENTLVMSLIDKREYGISRTDHFMILDLKSEKLKKDIKLDQTTDTYGKGFKYSDNGKKLYLISIYKKVLKNICSNHINVVDKPKKTTFVKECQDRLLAEHIKDKFTTLDLETGQLSPYYSYNCDELIPKKLNNNEVESYCKASIDSPINTTIYYSGYKKHNKLARGITIYDKDSFKPKKIITADNRLDTKFTVRLISEDGQYVLFEKIIRNSDEQIINKKYVVYDLRNDKAIHSFDTPFTIYGGGGKAFIDKNTLLFEYGTDIVMAEDGGISSKRNLGIVNLVTNEKKSFSCGEKKICSITQGIYNLNNKYIMWQWYSVIYIFDKKEMKIVQEFEGVDKFTVSRDFKKVAFYTFKNNDLYIYNITQGE